MHMLNGVHNPNARFQKAISMETYLKAALIADPINLMDASPMGDGAAAGPSRPGEICFPVMEVTQLFV